MNDASPNSDSKVIHINEYCPAFPTSGHNGMALRDYFAAKAMQGLITTDPIYAKECGSNRPSTAYEFAKCAYEMADAMLKERLKDKERVA